MAKTENNENSSMKISNIKMTNMDMTNNSNNDTKFDNPENKNIHDIYDRIFKRIMTLSSQTIIRFINGIFQTEYDINSTIDYNWTENVDNDLRKTIADTILTINKTDSYHMEAQMYKDDDSIIFRVFDYGYRHALRNAENVFNSEGIICGMKLNFPRQIVIYLEDSSGIPDEYGITLVFENGNEFTISVPTLKYQDKDLKEIIEKNLIILLPFKLLKIRNGFEKAYSNQNYDKLEQEISRLRETYERDIISTIENSYKQGVISREDMNVLIHLSHMLFEHLYSKYKNVKEVDNMLHDESLDLEIDRVYDQLDLLNEKLAEQNNMLAEKDGLIAEKDGLIAEKDDMLAKKDSQIAELSAQLAELQSKN